MAHPIELPDCAQKLLEFLYPNVDWSRVIFYSGMPSWVSSGTVGITLPDPLSLSGYRVYLKNTDFCSDTGTRQDAISSLVHEAFHIQQFMGSFGGGYGFGWLRPGFFNYLVCYASCGFSTDAGHGNAFEDGAYQEEDCFNACRKNQLKVCDCASGAPLFNPAALDVLRACKGKPECKDPLIVSKPRVPSGDCGPWWAVALAFIGALIAVPILALIAFVAYLYNLLDCHYLAIRWRQCRDWGQHVRQECSQWADNGYSQCNSWADEGYSACGQWSSFATSHCCTWRPCSWLCKVLVWVTTTVCTLTVWIANLVCKITVWIANLVCTLWTYFVELICLLWTSFLRFVLLCWLR